MDVNGIREALHARPFQAFRLRHIVVINPADESAAILEPPLIVSLEYAGPAPIAPPPNGDSERPG